MGEEDKDEMPDFATRQEVERRLNRQTGYKKVTDAIEQIRAFNNPKDPAEGLDPRAYPDDIIRAIVAHLLADGWSDRSIARFLRIPLDECVVIIDKIQDDIYKKGWDGEALLKDYNYYMTIIRQKALARQDLALAANITAARPKLAMNIGVLNKAAEKVYFGFLDEKGNPISPEAFRQLPPEEQLILIQQERQRIKQLEANNKKDEEKVEEEIETETIDEEKGEKV